MRLFFAIACFSAFFILFNPPVWAQSKLTPSLSIMSVDGQDTLFNSTYVWVRYSPDSSYASIRHESVYRLVFELPYHQLRMDHLEVTWDIEGQKIFFHSTDTHDRFYSSNPQKELDFHSSDGVLDLKTKKLSLKNIPGILSGSALIIPKDHELQINSSDLPEIKDAQVIFNSFTRYHHFECSQVSIASRRDFHMKGGIRYQYYHAPTRKTYDLHGVSLSIDTVVANYSVAFVANIDLDIKERDKFEIFDGYYFKGNAQGIDSSPSLTFKGFIKKVKGGKEWEPYEGNAVLGKF